MTYEMITAQSVETMTDEERAIATDALKKKAIAGGWSIGTKYGEFIEGAGNSWVATIGIKGFPTLFVGRDGNSELTAIMKAFSAVQEAIKP